MKPKTERQGKKQANTSQRRKVERSTLAKTFPAHKHIERDSNKIGNLIYSNVAWKERKRELKSLQQRKRRNAKQSFFKNKKYERVIKTTYRKNGEC